MIKKFLNGLILEILETVQPVSNFVRHFNRQISHGYIMVEIFNRKFFQILTVVKNLVMILVN